MKTTVLMLEDDAERLARFHDTAARLGLDIVSWADAHLMIAEVQQVLPVAALVSLDHDLEPTGPRDPGDGLDVAKFLAALAPLCPIIVHTSNGPRGDAMMGEFELAGWDHHRVAPLGDDWIECDWHALVRRLIRNRS
jgi:FixJ family two-component response regulator